MPCGVRQGSAPLRAVVSAAAAALEPRLRRQLTNGSSSICSSSAMAGPYPFYSAAILKEVNVHLTQETHPAPPGLIGIGTWGGSSGCSNGDFPLGNEVPYGEPLGTGLPGTGFDVATLPRTYSIEIPYDGTWQLFIVGGHGFTGPHIHRGVGRQPAARTGTRHARSARPRLSRTGASRRRKA